MTITLIILYQRQKKHENRSYKINSANYKVLCVCVCLFTELLIITDMSSGIAKIGIKDYTNYKQNQNHIYMPICIHLYAYICIHLY